LGAGAPARTSGVFILPCVFTLSAYSCAARSHSSGVLTRRSYSHFWRTHAPLFVLAVSVTPGVVSSRSSHTPCVGSLFSRYPSRPAWSRRGRLTCLAWARCSRGICHARRGLVAVLSHALRGLVVLAVSIMPGVVSSRSPHTPCVGSLFVWWLVVTAPVSRVERGRSVERDNIRFRSNVRDSTGLMHSSLPYHPHGAPIFPWYRQKKRKKKRKKKNAQAKQKQNP